MNQNKHFYILTSAIGIILAIIALGLYLSTRDKNYTATRRTVSSRSQTGKTVNLPDLEQLKSQEFLDLSTEPEKFSLSERQPLAYANNPVSSTPDTFVSKREKPRRLTGLNTRTTEQQPSLYAQAQQTTDSTRTLGTKNTTVPLPTQAAGSFAPLGSYSQQKSFNEPFAPYMASLPKEQAEKLEKQLNGLSDRVEAAILRAFLPKSKKDMNIEKYLAHRGNSTNSSASTSTPNANPFAGVAQQFNRQKTELVDSMKQAFGDKAAGQAGRIMDSYQKEIMNTLNQPGLTPEQIQQKTHKISQKYNKQLQKLSEKSGLERMEKERTELDNVFQDNLTKSYGADMADQLGNILTKYRQQELELAQKGLPADEYYEQLLTMQRQRHKDMENLLTENGRSLKGLLDAENKQEQTNIEQQLQDEQEGKILPKIYHASEEEKTAFGNSLNQERNDKVHVAQDMYGSAGAELVNQVYNRYYDEATRIMEDEETSLLEKQQQLMEARKKANEEIERIQNSPEMKRLREDKQVNETMQQLLKDAAFTQATEEQKEQFEKTARPILHDMFARINEVTANPNLTDDQKKQQIQAIQQQAQRQLAGP